MLEKALWLFLTDKYYWGSKSCSKFWGQSYQPQNIGHSQIPEEVTKLR
jgi:hypothetical protein